MNVIQGESSYRSLVFFIQLQPIFDFLVYIVGLEGFFWKSIHHSSSQSNLLLDFVFLFLLNITVDASQKNPTFGSRTMRLTACKFNMQNISDFGCLIDVLASKLRLFSLLSLVSVSILSFTTKVQPNMQTYIVTDDTQHNDYRSFRRTMFFALDSRSLKSREMARRICFPPQKALIKFSVFSPLNPCKLFYFI